MDMLYAFLFVVLIAMAYDIRRDIRLSQQSLEHIAQTLAGVAAMVKDVSDKTDAILGRLR